MKDLHFLQGLEENYTNITEKDDNSIYITKDTLKGFLGDKKLWVTENELNSIINNINNKLDEISGESYGTTTSDKLSYLLDTKSWIKGAIEYQGQPVPDNTTFRLYHTAIGEIGRKVPVIDYHTVDDILNGGKVIFSNQGSNVNYSLEPWFEPIGKILVEDYGTPASGGQTIIKKISGAGQLFFNFNGEPNGALNMAGLNNFYITMFSEVPYGFELRFISWDNVEYNYQISFTNKLKSKNWNHIIIPISDIISTGMNIQKLSGILMNGSSSESESVTMYINDMYFK
jgi:hypothetical protein